MNPTNSESTESCLSSRAHSSEIFSSREDDDNNEAPHHVKRPSIVTFRDPESADVIAQEECCPSENGRVTASPKVERNVKKGVCYRCLKGSRLTKKEVCIVCGAKYCHNCVLRAMGSMPEGRKCVTCIGVSIDEARRGMLGKYSTLLKRLLSDSEVKRIMEAEVFCQINQIPPELVFVNDEPLSQEELVLLQNSKNPPRNLRPGCYWYDRVSGFWGKEGQKPSQIISSQLNIGGDIKRNASNGNTNVLINSREITKEELWMLKVAGVPCEGNPHFWVSEDGSIQEEGQNNMRDRIWDKTRTKLVCAFFSLPVPPDLKNPSGVEANGVIPANLVQISLHKLLLVGYNKSGTCTIYKQATVLGDLEVISPAVACEYAPCVEELWKDAAIQATYNRRNELAMLPRAATYFLDRAVEISRADYEPNEMDILYAEGITSSNSLACMEFSFPKSTRDDLVEPEYQHDPSLRYQLIRLHPRSLGANCKWLDMFVDADILLFCVALTDYDEYSENGNGVLTNKMLGSKQLFESVVTHPTFHNKNVLLILNKFDLLEEKIGQAPLTRCEWFCDFNPFTTQNLHNRTNPSLAQRAFHYIAMKFKTLFLSLTARKLFVSLTTGLENDTVDEALRYAREIVMWEKEKPQSINEWSSTDIEASSTS
ncbi:Extra-large guanine nucleotide-binding protein 1 [Morella rubra]|nr:Extra-large guanine nucleotide-binding protein 1 [Morella rubra]